MKIVRKRYGLTPWGGFFLDAMEKLADEGRLGRGQSCAKNERFLNFNLEDSLVRARVKGNHRPYYDIIIGFRTFTREEKSKICRAVRKDPMYFGSILAGELPLDLMDLLKDAGVALLPEKWGDMKRACSCPDYGDPCKHMAAVYYLIAQEIDRDPFFVFRLRGLDLKEEFDSAGNEQVPPPFELRPGLKPWTPSEASPEFPHCENYGPFILGLLPASPPVAPYDMKAVLSEFYKFSAERYSAVFVPEPSELADLQHRVLARAEISVEIREDLQNTSIRVKAASAGGSHMVKDDGLFHFCRRFLGFSSGEGTPSYKFFFYFSRALFLVLQNQAFVPDVFQDKKSYRILYRPARFGNDIKELFRQVEDLLPACVFLKSGKSLPALLDRRSSFAALSMIFLSDYVRALGFLPKNRNIRTQPLCLAFFLGLRQQTGGPGHGSLPSAVDRWLSVFDLSEDQNKYELMVDRKENGVMALSAFVHDRKGRHLPLKDAAAVMGSDVLKFPAMLAGFLPSLRVLGRQASVVLDEDSLFDFLTETGPLFTRLGIGIVLPRELQRLAVPKPVLVAKKKGMENLTTFLDLESILDFEWKICVGETMIDPGEFRKLVKAGTKLVRFRDQYVRISPEEAAYIINRISQSPELKGVDLIQEVFSGSVVLDGLAAPLFDNLFKTKDRDLPRDLKADLRPYQVRGFLWAYTNLLNGFGCVIADDMGLGKTIQTIALMLALKEDGRLGNGCLVVVPASLCVNWEREIARFAPSLSVCVFMGNRRTLRKNADVVITSYQTFVKDHEKILGRSFDLLVLDEAHTIKNPDTRQSKTVRQAQVPMRLALSGTPVENNLSELWSIFDYVIPGYLKSLTYFVESYRVPIEIGRDRDRAERLKRITSPFLLRRLKTDKTVIADLPEKITIDEYAVLSVKQAALYESVTAEAVRLIESTGRQDRFPLILKLITGLKQICNHPRNFDKESP
ncbi:MAG: DEAD/DEAH box helicase, partial [Spirochaetales bacterium]